MEISEDNVKLHQAMLRRQELLDRIRHERQVNDELRRPRSYTGKRYRSPSPIAPSRHSLPERGNRHVIEHQFRHVQQSPVHLPPIQQHPPSQPIYYPPPVVEQKNSKAELMELMLMQNAQIHQMVMQQMMLSAIPPKPYQNYPSEQQKPTINHFHQYPNQYTQLPPIRTQGLLPTRHEHRPLPIESLRKFRRAAYAAYFIKLLANKRFRLRTSDKNTSFMFGINLKEIVAALHRIYLEPTGKIYSALRDAISEKSSPYAIIFDSNAKKEELKKTYTEMEYVVENVVYGITAIMISTSDKTYHSETGFDAYSIDKIDENLNERIETMERDTKEQVASDTKAGDKDNIPMEENLNEEISYTAINYNERGISHDKEIRQMIELNKSEEIGELLLSNIELNKNLDLTDDDLDSMLENTNVEEIKSKGNNVRFKIEDAEEAKIDLEKELINNEAELSPDVENDLEHLKSQSNETNALKIEEVQAEKEIVSEIGGKDERSVELPTEPDVERTEPTFDNQLDNKEVMEEAEREILVEFAENENVKGSKSLEIKEINIEAKETNNEGKLREKENEKLDKSGIVANVLNLEEEQKEQISRKHDVDGNLNLDFILKTNQDKVNPQTTSIKDEYDYYKDLEETSVTIDELVKINMKYLI
ncbi:DgyrCDS5635 [Dimorphilus gyrociliatus]|uniref:DgyrCDS5635 n=1 Tax=Dimorphilus gyrociliatus TaxID=2664684 RepID=A0A7I8VMT0_9ANNE|nr:DgyrCDS5635 [Dimorphilus gyrociliatus]